jgi:hypothetical protein
MPTISNHSWTPKHGKSPVISFITQFLIDFRVITFTEEDNPEGVFLNIVDDAVVAIDRLCQEELSTATEKGRNSGNITPELKLEKGLVLSSWQS